MNRAQKFSLFSSVIICIVFIVISTIQIMGFLFISNIQSSLAETKLRINRMITLSENLTALEKRFSDINPDIPKINTALPDQKDSALLISDIDSLATSSGLKFTMIQTNTAGKKGTTQSDLSLLQTVKGKNSYELPLEVRLEGSFSGFAVFIQKLENYQRLVSISSIDISKNSSDGDKTDRIEAKIKLTAYLKK